MEHDFQRLAPSIWRSALLIVGACGLAIASALPSGGPGVGLGVLWFTLLLAMCHRLLNAHGGSVSLVWLLIGMDLLMSLLCVSALWSTASSIPMPVVQWSLRVSFTAVAAILAVALRPLAAARPDAPPAAALLASAVPVLAVPIALLSPLLTAGRSAPGLRLTALGAEDGAAWVSQTLATLRHGHLPNVISESEFAFYPLTSATVGSVFHTIAHGRPSDDAAILSAADAVAASWILSGLTLGTASLVLMALFMPSRVRGHRGRLVAASILASLAIQTTVWALVLPLAGLQQLSLAWSGSAVAALVVMITATGRSPSPRAIPAVAVLLLSTAASASWPFGLLGLGMAFICYSAILWARGGWSALPLIVSMLVGLTLGVAELLEYLPAFGATPTSLLGGRGGVIEVSGVAIVMLVVGLLAAFASPVHRWPLRIVLVTTASLAIGALAIWLIATSSYAPGKAIYLTLLTLPLGLALGLGWITSLDSAAVRWPVLVAVAILVALAPLTGRALDGVAQIVAEPQPGFGDRLLRLAEAGSSHDSVACLPSKELEAYENYLCQRWADAFSWTQSDSKLRLHWLDSDGDMGGAIQRARAEGLLDGDVLLVDARSVIAG